MTITFLFKKKIFVNNLVKFVKVFKGINVVKIDCIGKIRLGFFNLL